MNSRLNKNTLTSIRSVSPRKYSHTKWKYKVPRSLLTEKNTKFSSIKCVYCIAKTNPRSKILFQVKNTLYGEIFTRTKICDTFKFLVDLFLWASNFKSFASTNLLYSGKFLQDKCCDFAICDCEIWKNFTRYIFTNTSSQKLQYLFQVFFPAFCLLIIKGKLMFFSH